MEAFPGPIGYEPVKEGGSGADDFGHHVVLRFGARQIHEPDPLYGIFSLQDFGDAQLWAYPFMSTSKCSLACSSTVCR